MRRDAHGRAPHRSCGLPSFSSHFPTQADGNSVERRRGSHFVTTTLVSCISWETGRACGAMLCSSSCLGSKLAKVATACCYHTYMSGSAYRDECSAFMLGPSQSSPGQNNYRPGLVRVGTHSQLIAVGEFLSRWLAAAPSAPTS